jgi:hypothetical protein
MVGLPEQVFEFIHLQFCVMQNFSKQPGTYCFTSMNRYDGCSTIRMFQKMMAAMYSNYNEPETLQNLNEFLSPNPWRVRHD